MFHAWKIWALGVRATDPCWPQHFLLLMSSQLLSSLVLLLCVEAGQQLRWGKRKLCTVVVQGLVWQITVCEWNSLRSASSLMGARWGCCLWCGCAVTACSDVGHRVNDFWLGFFSVPTGHPCPSIVKPTLAWLAGAYSKAWWKRGVVVVELGHWGIGCVCKWALVRIAGVHIYKVFIGPLSTVIVFEAWFPLSSASPQNLQAWSIKECEIYSKSHCCLFLSQQGCAFFSSLELFAVENKQSLFLWFLTSLWDMMPSRKPAVPIWELPLPSCSLVDCVESMKCCNTVEKRGVWRNEEGDHTEGIYRRGFISCHMVHCGCVWI